MDIQVISFVLAVVLGSLCFGLVKWTTMQFEAELLSGEHIQAE